MQSKEFRITELVNIINKNSYNYYVLDNPTISDSEWDKLYDELQQLEHETGIILSDSPSKRVGSVILKGFEPHKHLNRLYSMDKVQNLSDLKSWITKIKNMIQKYNSVHEDKLPEPLFCVEYKLDGLTINLTYDNGFLIEASTRGNGETGEAILAQAKTIKSVPLSLPYKHLLEVQGECIMRLSILKDFNKIANSPLKNARNAAAGAIRNLDPNVTAKRKLSAFFYQIGTIETNEYDNHIDMLNFIKNNNLPLIEYSKTAKNFDDILSCITEIEESRNKLDFLIDGVVIKINDFKTRELLGYTEKFPRWAIAFKFAAEENITKLVDVSWEVGRTGKITPIAHLEPTQICGATVKRATLNNIDDITKKNVTIGCNVWVRRANDVIPEITGRVDDKTIDEAPITEPEYCPACNRKLIRSGVNLYCPGGIDCKPQAVGKLAHFASRDAMDIDSFSQKTAELFYDYLSIRDVSDLYSITYKQLIELPSFKERKAKSFLKAIENSKVCNLDSFIYSLGISNVGKKTARDLARHFITLENLIKAPIENLVSIPEIGNIIAKSVNDYFQDNYELITKLLKSGIKVNSIVFKNDDNKTLKDKKFIITGTLPNLSRKEAEKVVLENGGIILSTVSKKLDYLVAGKSPGSKMDKSMKLNIKIINEETLLDWSKNGIF